MILQVEANEIAFLSHFLLYPKNKYKKPDNEKSNFYKNVANLTIFGNNSSNETYIANIRDDYAI